MECLVSLRVLYYNVNSYVTGNYDIGKYIYIYNANAAEKSATISTSLACNQILQVKNKQCAGRFLLVEINRPQIVLKVLT